MRLTMSVPCSRKGQKNLAVLRAVYAAEPGREKQAAKKALKRFRKERRAA